MEGTYTPPFLLTLNNMSEKLKHDDYKSLIVDALSNKHFPFIKVIRLTEDIDRQYKELLKADGFLKYLEANYNNTYPAKYPGCIDQSLSCMEIICKSVRTCADLMKELSPICNIRRQRCESMGVPYPSKFNNSYLCINGPRQYTIPFKEGFIPQVYTLVDSIDRYLNLFMDDLELIRHLREEEKILKTLTDETEKLYNSFFAEVEEEWDSMRMYLSVNNFDVKDNAIFKARLQYPNFQEFVKNMFHNFTPTQLRHLFYAILAGLCKPLQSSNEELMEDIPSSKRDKYKVCPASYENEVTDTIIAEFNDYIPSLKRGTLYKIQGETLAYFALALGVSPDGGAKAFHNYFDRKYDGGLKVCRYNTFHAKLNDINLHSQYETDHTYKKFAKRINDLKKNANSNGNILNISDKSRIRS